MTVGKIFLVFAGLWLMLPAGLFALYTTDTERGLLWLLLHQLYYAPFGTWIAEPFFTPDSDVGYWVRPLGRVLAAVFYAAAIFGARAAILSVGRRVARSRTSDSST
jgi:hypothetical protein